MINNKINKYVFILSIFCLFFVNKIEAARKQMLKKMLKFSDSSKDRIDMTWLLQRKSDLLKKATPEMRWKYREVKKISPEYAANRDSQIREIAENYREKLLKSFEQGGKKSSEESKNFFLRAEHQRQKKKFLMRQKKKKILETDLLEKLNRGTKINDDVVKKLNKEFLINDIKIRQTAAKIDAVEDLMGH